MKRKVISPIVSFLLVCMPAVTLLAAPATRADDGAMGGMGGNTTIMRPPHPTISMVNEVVRIDRLPDGHVNAVFTFKSEGPACTVTIGFPGSGGGDAIDDTKLEDFRSWVDGKRITVKRVDEHQSLEPDTMTSWYVKRVHFDRGQTHIITDDYIGGGGGSSVGDRDYAYILNTGASWHKPIAHGEIIVDASGLTKWGFPELSPSRFIRHGSTAIWQFRNLRPNKSDDVNIAWVPCFTDIAINGGKLKGYGGIPLQEEGIGENVYSQRRGIEVWLPADLAAEWLGAKMTKISKGNYRITLGNRWVDFRTWSNALIPSAGRKVILPYPVDIEMTPRCDDPDVVGNGETFDCAGYHMIGLIGLIRALGGTAHFDKDNISLIATLPGYNAPKGASRAGK